MTLSPQERQPSHQSASSQHPLTGSLSSSFSLQVVATGTVGNSTLTGKIQEILLQTDIMDMCAAIMGQCSSVVEVEVKPSLREPQVSFTKPGCISITLSSKYLDTEVERVRVEKAILLTGFVRLAVQAAEAANRRGGVGAEDQELCRRIAHHCVDRFRRSEPTHAAAQLSDQRAIVRDLLSILLQKPAGKSSGKKAKCMPNPHREGLEKRKKESLSQLATRIDCSTPERAEAAISTTMQCIARVKACGDLLGDTRESDGVIAGAMGRLRTSLREQFARGLIACDRERCDAVLESFKFLHAEVARGGCHRGLPTLLRVPLPNSATPLEEISFNTLNNRNSKLLGLGASGMNPEVLVLRDGVGPAPHLTPVPSAATLAAEVRELHELLVLNQELHLELKAAQSDFIDHVIMLEVLAPRLAQTLLCIGRGDTSADPGVFDDLLVAALAMRLDPSGNGIWYHDVLLSGRDIPPPQQRNPELNAHARADVYLEAMRILKAWRDSSEQCAGKQRHADIIEDNRDFFVLFVSSCARLAVFTYENQCAMALAGGNDEFINGAPLIYDDIAAIEANLPFMMEFIPNKKARPIAERMLRDSINNVRAGLHTLAQMRMGDDLLLRSMQETVQMPTSGPLAQYVSQVSLQLQQRVERYAESLTQGAKEQLEELFLQDSAYGLVEHSKRLLDVVRLDPLDSQSTLLAQMVEAKIRSFVELIDEAYSDPINRVVGLMQNFSGPFSSGIAADEQDEAHPALRYVEQALLSVNFMVKELRLIREGIASYKDLIPPPSVAQSESSGVISRAPVVELTSLLSEQMTGKLSRALKSQPALVRRVHQKLVQHVEQGAPEEQREAQQALDGLTLLRLPRNILH